ncbi:MULTISPECIES: hypothetical protein [unclassified Rhizobium]|uniref:hypothetical protein n=1 Tax=unclassified Rhizobium TaxID=2613769 RepID=UPI0006FEDE14|nr:MULTISPECIES: hypothetical protein [unclassified Rhizobium]KQV36697.1 hypothetical protein ASC86_24505 [Rhizobium sp. Root1212]KRD28515.1 hypothetical protein ASE37_24270 [Rhizobium sp. Root268]
MTDDCSRSNIDAVREEITRNFGGATLYLHSPAEGIWENNGALERDLIIVAEAMTSALDRAWWAEYRLQLQILFYQDEILIRATSMERL